MDIDPSLVSRFHEDGYCLAPSCLTEETIEVCRAYLRHASPAQGRTAVYNLFEQNPDLALALVSAPAIIDLCEAVMGPFVQLDGLALVGLARAEHRPVAGWHRDPWGQVPRSAAFERPLAINVLIYLQDLTDDIGPFRVIPGSHREPDMVIAAAGRRQPHPREHRIHARVGEVLFVHNNVIHSGTPPAVHIAERSFISIFYNHSWLKQTIQFSGPNAVALKRKIAAEGCVRLKRLFGDDPTLLARNDMGFLDEEPRIWRQWMDEDRAG
jgi:hypothetical protein